MLKSEVTEANGLSIGNKERCEPNSEGTRLTICTRVVDD